MIEKVRPERTGRYCVSQIVDKVLFMFHNRFMLTHERTHQSEMEFISIEDMVPSEHLLRKIEKSIDFGFIYEKVEVDR